MGTLNAQVSSQPLCDHHGKCPCRPLPVDERVPPHGYLHSARRPLCSSPQPPACVSSVLIAPKFFTLTSAAQRTYSPRPLLRPLTCPSIFPADRLHRHGFKTVPVKPDFLRGVLGRGPPTTTTGIFRAFNRAGFSDKTPYTLGLARSPDRLCLLRLAHGGYKTNTVGRDHVSNGTSTGLRVALLFCCAMMSNHRRPIGGAFFCRNTTALPQAPGK